MIETLSSPTLPRCAYCQAALSEFPELEFEDWIVRCFQCGAKNIIELALHQPVIDVAVIGWRE